MSQQPQEPEIQEQLLKEVFRVAKIGSWEMQADDRLVWSDQTHEIFGVSSSEFNGTIEEFHRLVHPDDLERVKLVEDFTDSQTNYFKSEYRIVRPDGDLRHMQQTAIVLRDKEDKPIGFSGVVQDVSEQVQTETRLRQSQNLAALGHLSGGVAHDFNNLLAGIMGAAELIQSNETYDAKLVQDIIGAAQRGGELTQRLLAFARKQPLIKTHIRLDELFYEIVPTMNLMVGQDIRIEVETDDQLWPIEADPARLKDSLINLVLNARDAITGSGTITIACQNVTKHLPDSSGDAYVKIEVSDTGMGMSEDIRLQAVTPFFTTKSVGKGSGLGLSMVDGFVRQSGGRMELLSTPCVGTEVVLYMPRAIAKAETPTLKNDTIHYGNGEKILVIEDDQALAPLLQRQLTGLGYRALLANNKETALKVAQTEDDIKVVLSDIILADGERGPFIVSQLTRLNPNLRTVFMTGFAPDSAEVSDVLDAQALILTKPFTIKELGKALQKAVTLECQKA
ncbi:PAS domain-containing hybrid sensor histidine kinase/response regulator [Shimia ponticola]|uniref:PAS domain-containing hybrid sensor histidine kinase/response regulator n=1 Tax=Shimia ponticola TaxID=2582893 RepID=UPI0011BF646E|nr:PAS domain-containing hybrid sensor histidine kinase/response regulator [Shimia ponticola]